MNLEDLENIGNEDGQQAKHLFSDKDIKLKTELKDRDIKLMMRLYFFERLTETGLIEKLLTDFMHLRVSKDRKSRSEFVESLKSSLLMEERLNSMERFIKPR